MILNENQIKDICHGALKRLKKGEEAEITFTTADSSLTRYANNTIHQNVNENNTNIMLFLYSGKRRGFARRYPGG